MRRISTAKFLCLGLCAGLFSIASPAWSQTRTDGQQTSKGGEQTNNEFVEYFRRQCQENSKFSTDNIALCIDMFPGGFGISGDGRLIGIQPTGDGGSKGGVKGRPGQIGVGSPGGGKVSAGAGDSGFGVLVAAVSGSTEREGTELENGFDSDLSGHVLGLDYQLTDSFILGITLGSIEDDLTVAGGGGALKCESDSQTVYATWVPVDNMSVDFYRGSVESDIDNRRILNIESDVVNMQGLISGSYVSDQTIQGVSINYDLSFSSWTIGGFLALDSVETETEGYAEEGFRTNTKDPGEPVTAPAQGDPTGFELLYPDQETESSTQSIGLRVAYGAEFGWGVLFPNVKIISVEEKKNDARSIPVVFASTAASPVPGEIEPFVVRTDDPDRRYMTGSVGIIAALNNGSQIFLEYEQRSGHEFLETSYFTLGALLAF